MSVQSEIARLETAKSAIKTAIEGKGVIVPDGTLLDGMAALIESIEAGGGSKIAFTTITPDSDTISLEFNHNLGATPNFIFWFDKKIYSYTHKLGLCIDLPNQDFRWYFYAYYFNTISSFEIKYASSPMESIGKLGYLSNGMGVISCDENSITFGNKGNNKIYFRSGITVFVLTAVIS